MNDEIILLKKIIDEPTNRVQNIREFQNIIWNSLSANDILIELSYDLDFYEPDKLKQNEDPTYYGNERLIKEIKDVLKRIDSDI